MKKILSGIFAVALALASIASPALAASVSIDGKLIAAGAPPVLTSCGTSPAIVGSDLGGKVTMGTGSPTGCVITFAQTHGVAPNCLVVWAGTPLAAQNYTVTTTAITLVQTGTSSNIVFYFCTDVAN
jgi:hypothetical protein